jgi:hypothetical protein
MRDRGILSSDQVVTGVDYALGDLEGVVAEQNAAGNAEGFIDNQLLALVRVEGEENPVVMIVTCMNGLISLPYGALEELERVGSHNTNMLNITVTPGDSLVSLLGYRAAIDAAEVNGYQLFKTPLGGVREAISYEDARDLAGSTDANLVTTDPVLMPGWQINTATLRIAP